VARSSLRDTPQFREGCDYYLKDAVVRSAVDKAIKKADKNVLRDILIFAYGQSLQGEYSQLSRDTTLALYGLQPEDIGKIE
jgi:hypothetical protein